MSCKAVAARYAIYAMYILREAWICEFRAANLSIRYILLKNHIFYSFILFVCTPRRTVLFDFYDINEHIFLRYNNLTTCIMRQTPTRKKKRKIASIKISIVQRDCVCVCAKNHTHTHISYLYCRKIYVCGLQNVFHWTKKKKEKKLNRVSGKLL